MRDAPETVVVVRHGETDYREAGRYQGDSAEPRLSDRGVRQSIELRGYLRPWRFSLVLSSDLPRAVQTYELLKDALPDGLPGLLVPDLREVCVPEWVGTLKRDIPSDQLRRWREAPQDFVTKSGGRPILDLYDRVGRAALQVESAQTDCLVVGHDHVNRALILALLGLPPDVHRSVPQGLSAISILHAEPHHDRFLLHASNLLHDDGISRPVQRSSRGRRILFVRHGVTSSNINRAYQGRMDAPLDALGVEQAKRLEGLLAGVPVELVVSSSLRRARQTAEHLPVGEHVARGADPRLNEYDYGHWSGLANAEVQERFPDEYAAWREASDDRPIRGAEPLSQVRARVAAALQDVVGTLSPAGTAIVVAHDIVIRTAITHLLGLETAHFWKFPIMNGALTEVELRDSRPHVIRRHNVLPGPLADRQDHDFF